MGLLRCVVAMGVLLFLAGAWSGCGASDRLYAEYVLPEPATPESTDCYEDCELSFVKSGRESCFARCGGVVERFTDAPCKQRGAGRCSFDRLSPGEERVAQNAVNSSWLADFLGRVFVGLVSGSKSHDDVETRADAADHSHATPRVVRRAAPAASRNVAARHRAAPRRGS